MTSDQAPWLSYEDRGGETPDTSIIIHASSHFVGVLAEHALLGKKLGVENRDWRLEMQALGGSGKRLWDMMVVKLKDGTSRTVYFDITEFYDKR
jgi:hypothetical protein